MTRGAGAWLAGVVAAVAVPAGILHALAGERRHLFGLTAAPFGWPRVLVAHLALAVPLGVVAAVALRRLAPAGGRAWAAGWASAGVVTAVAVGALTPVLGDALDARDAGFYARAAARTAVAAVLVVPWLAAAAGLAATAPAAAPGRGPFAVALLLAAVPPAAYVARLTAAGSEQFNKVYSLGMAAQARAQLEGLCELGSDRPVAGAAPAKLRPRLDRLLRQLVGESYRPLPAGAPPEARRARAFVLVQLDRPAEAEALLAPLADADLQAALLLGAVYRDQERWGEARRLYERARVGLLPAAGTDPAALGGCVAAFDGLALAAKSTGRPEEAERVYREAIEALPAAAAHFHLALGRHYQDAGLPALALDRYREAVQLDAAYGGQVEPLVQSLRLYTPACLLPR